MKRYTYIFSWNDKEGNYQRKYLDAASREDAIIDFEKTYDLKIRNDHIKIARKSF